MTRSDWGDWLVCEIEDSAPDGVAIWYLGCNGFVLNEYLIWTRLRGVAIANSERAAFLNEQCG